MQTERAQDMGKTATAKFERKRRCLCLVCLYQPL